MSGLNRAAALAAIVAALACALPASAGEDAPAAQPPQTVPEDTAPGRSGSSTEPLGEKLDWTKGVIHPPRGVDPEMSLEPPPTGPDSTPVIPPPGTPGGEPGVEPK